MNVVAGDSNAATAAASTAPEITTSVPPPGLVEDQLPPDALPKVSEQTDSIETTHVMKLGGPTLVRIEQENVNIRRRMQKYMRRIDKATAVHRVRQVRFEAINFARTKKAEGSWDPESDGALLQEVIRSSHKKESLLSKGDNRGEALEAPELTKMLRTDPYQHTCDVKGCIRTSLGWLCVFFFCHVPWIIVIFIIGVGYHESIIVVPGDPQNNSTINSTTTTALSNASCASVSTYLFGFFIIYCVNVVVGLAFAIARVIDDSQNSCMRLSPYVMGFIGISIIGYNVYGIVVVWSYDLWYYPVTAECGEIRGLAIAVITFFFILPLVCFGLQKLLGNREKTKREEAEAAEDRLSSTNASAISSLPPTSSQKTASTPTPRVENAQVATV